MTSVWKIKTFLFLIVNTDITPSIKPLKKTTNLFDEFFNFLYERIPAINKNEKIEIRVKTLVVLNLDNKKSIRLLYSRNKAITITINNIKTSAIRSEIIEPIDLLNGTFS